MPATRVQLPVTPSWNATKRGFAAGRHAAHESTTWFVPPARGASVNVKVVLTVATPAPDALTVTVDELVAAELTTVSTIVKVVVVPTVTCVFDTVTPAGRPVTLMLTSPVNPPTRETEAVMVAALPMGTFSIGAPSEMRRADPPGGGEVESSPPEHPSIAARAMVDMRRIARRARECGMSQSSSQERDLTMRPRAGEACTWSPLSCVPCCMARGECRTPSPSTHPAPVARWPNTVESANLNLSKGTSTLVVSAPRTLGVPDSLAP